jgi:hypothetical protein
MKKLIAALVLVAGFILGTSALAGATPANPGQNTSCTAGTDHCSGWLPSANYPCAVYNVLWDHTWANSNNPGGEAFWRVQIDQWWACGDQGGVHLIGNVGVFYMLDTGVPHNEVVGPWGKVEFAPGLYSSPQWDLTYNVTEWSKCGPALGEPWGRSKSIWVSYATVPSHTFAPGIHNIGMTCQSWTGGATRQVLSTNYNGAFVMWDHYNRLDVAGDAHTFSVLTLF